MDGTLEIGSGKYWRAECAGESYESSVQTEKVGTAVSKVWRGRRQGVFIFPFQRKATGNFTSSVGDKKTLALPSVPCPCHAMPYHQVAASGSGQSKQQPAIPHAYVTRRHTVLTPARPMEPFLAS